MGSLLGVKYSLTHCELRYILDMPLEYFDVCDGRDVIHTFRMMPEYEDRWARHLCSKPWCASCYAVRQGRLKLKIHRYLIYRDDPHLWFLTRSVKNSTSLKQAFDSLHATIATFTKNKKTQFRQDVRSYIGTYEIVHSLKTGFNLHQHLIIGTEVDRLDYKQYSADWSNAAGYTAHHNVAQLRSPGAAIQYLSSYITKGFWGGLSQEMTYWNRSVLFGRHRIRTKQRTAPPKMSDPDRCFCCKTWYRDCNFGHVVTDRGG